MQQADHLNVAFRGGAVDDEMTGRAAPPPNVEGANSRANFIARAAGRVLRMLKQLAECAFDQRAIFLTLPRSPTTIALPQGVGNVPTRRRGKKQSHQFLVFGRHRDHLLGFDLVEVNSDLRARAQHLEPAFIDVEATDFDGLT